MVKYCWGFQKGVVKRMKYNRISKGEKVFYIFNYIFLALCAFVTIFPLFHIVAISFSDSVSIMSKKVFLWPNGFNIQAYKNIIAEGKVFNAFKNSVVLTGVGTAINMVATIICAYPLSKKRLKGRNFFMGMIFFTMLFGGGLIPMFLLVKSLRIMDTYWSLWLPGLFSVYNMIVMRTFFMGIPDSLEEAAQLDGANDIYILFHIVLPLSLPAIATLSLFYAVTWWNEFFSVMIYITNSKKVTLSLLLMQMIQTMSDSMLQSGEGALEKQERLVSASVEAASFVIATIPILCVYPFVQKYFVKGVMLGSVKS